MANRNGKLGLSLASPDGWVRSRLIDVTERITVGLAISVTQHYRDGGVPLIRNQNICDGWFDDTDMVSISPDFADSQASKATRARDLLTVRTGANIGQTCVVPPRLAGSQSFTTLITSTDWNKILPEYLCFHMQSPLGLSEIERLQVGGGKGNLNAGHLADYRIDVPPLDEQHAIVRILNTWDACVHKLPLLIAAKLRFKQGLMQQLLTGRRRFKEFKSTEFVETHVGDVLKETLRPVDWDDDRLYRLASIRRHSGGLFWREALRGSQIKVKKLHALQENDFLISHIQAAYGAMGLVSAEFAAGTVSDMYTILTPKKPGTIDMRYVEYLSQMKRMRHQAYLACNGFFAERLRLNFDPTEFLKQKILLPETLAEQTKIADLLDTLVSEIKTFKRELDALQTQKKGLMQKLLTGQVRVKP